MKYLFLLASLVLLGCSQQDKDCTKFRTGTFKYGDSTYENFIVTRDDSTQVEIDLMSDVKMIASIEWLSDCKYVLTYKEVVNLDKNNLIGKKIEVEIIETYDTCYRCIAMDDMEDFKMVKID